MTFYVENETAISFPFQTEELLSQITAAVLKEERCPYQVQISLVITDSDGIREINREYRNIDSETDVLSFPAIDFEVPGSFSGVSSDPGAFDPETGELILGDIMINADRVISGAEQYGHSQTREFAFLVAHSLFHLCGYDHMTDEERVQMEEKQSQILELLGITRDYTD